MLSASTRRRPNPIRARFASAFAHCFHFLSAHGNAPVTTIAQPARPHRKNSAQQRIGKMGDMQAIKAAQGGAGGADLVVAGDQGPIDGIECHRWFGVRQLPAAAAHERHLRVRIARIGDPDLPGSVARCRTLASIELAASTKKRRPGK
jgi:hypothetical protein